MNYTVNDIASTTKTVLFKDTKVDGSIDGNGNIVEVTNNDAFENAFKIWLHSTKGDSLRSLQGGYLTSFIGKPMNSETALAIKDALKIGLNQEFSHTFTIVDLAVVPDYTAKKWFIRIVGYDSRLQSGLNTIEEIGA